MSTFGLYKTFFDRGKFFFVLGNIRRGVLICPSCVKLLMATIYMATETLPGNKSVWCALQFLALKETSVLHICYHRKSYT